MCFFLNNTPPTEISPLPLHDALPISVASERPHLSRLRRHQLMAHPTCTDEAETVPVEDGYRAKRRRRTSGPLSRSEEHTSELQSRLHLVCRLLLEKKSQERLFKQI